MITTDTHVYFYTARPFHNWVRTEKQFIDPLANDGVFESTEQAFMWWKAAFFQDWDTRGLIYDERDPRAVKELGRLIRGYNDAAWSCVRLGYMAYVNLLKYQQNPEWADTLLATGNRIIVEASPIDRVWGVGLSEKDPLILDAANWKGENLLGEALMTVRGLLKG